MSFLMVDLVELLGKPRQTGAHEGGKRNLLHLDDEVEVVGHQAKAVNQRSILIDHAGQAVLHKKEIVFTREYHFAAIAAVDAVI